MPGELVLECKQQTLHQQARSGRESALLSIGHCPGPLERYVQLTGVFASVELFQHLEDVRGVELARGALRA